ncbi:phosphatase PAP2 family protein [Streptomyces sp. NPDC015220]|uniref:phosphatase PAP2 family protein n=1 Tax=Streptomyces sp. NPDC015220 TaxID=3364947 RepID=UPI00370324D0
MSIPRDQDIGQAPARTDGPRPDAGRPARGPVPRLALVAVPAALFALITWQVVGKGPLLAADRRASRALIEPDRASELLSDLGNVQIAVPALILVLGYVAWRGLRAGAGRWWAAPLAAAVLMALLPAVVVPLKDWTGRHGTSAVPPGAGYYPSGHTATAVVAYGGAALVLLPWLRTARARRVALGLCAALVLAVSYGLVRRGYHWPLDVVAGWCLGAVLLSALWLVIRRLSRSRRRSSSGRRSRCSGPS